MKYEKAMTLFIATVTAAASLWLAEPAAAKETDEPRKSLQRVADAVMHAYPGVFAAVEEPVGLYLETQNGKIFVGPWEGCPKAPPPEFPEDAPLCAAFEQLYPAGKGHRTPPPGFDPGRVRNEAFLRLLFGGNAAEVEGALANVPFMGETVRFSTRFGAHKALERVAGKLEALADKDPSAKAYIAPTGGTYAWRRISKTSRLSAHSFGICIDLNVEKGLYWQWRPAVEAVERVRKEYPQEIVDAFESEGFVWGGKWSAFDYMHFEFRPELLEYARVLDHK